MMHETEDKLYEGEVLTGRYYVKEGRKSYDEEKIAPVRCRKRRSPSGTSTMITSGSALPI